MNGECRSSADIPLVIIDDLVVVVEAFLVLRLGGICIWPAKVGKLGCIG